MGSRTLLRARLRRARMVTGAALVLVTGGLTAAVAGAIPGRDVDRLPTLDPFREPLTRFPLVSPVGSPASPSAAPIAVSGAS